jgi:carbamoyltransferase
LRILGLVTETHDSGLALLEDGVPALVLEEERLNREKHTLEFPRLSLEAAFDELKISISDIDVITTPWDIRQLRKTFAKAVLSHLPGSLTLLRPSAHASQDSGITLLNFWLKLNLRIALRAVRLPPIVQVGHHDAHAAIYFVSPFEEAAVLVMDGYGDVSATSTYVGLGNRLECCWRGEFFDSIGMLYTFVTHHLGFNTFEEGTVMALAACGGATYVAKFRDVVRLRDGGQFSLNSDYLCHDRYGEVRPFTQKFFELFGAPRKRDEPITDHHRDLAYALQATTEETVLHVLRALSVAHPSRNLVLTGGVALNCVANARVLRDTHFRRVWVPPCTSDTGAPFGSTLWHHHQTLGNPREFEMTHAFYGMAYSPDQMRLALGQAGLEFEELGATELVRRVARDLAENRIVGWYQDRFEMGPRALGNRSILASPLRREMRDLINARIKFREPFRPFAPAVLAEYAADYFEISQPDPFMTFAPRVRPDKVGVIPAAVHVDGTGRVQTVDRQTNPRYYGVIEEFMKLTGVPVVLNTSFNKQEPVVARPEEAISCFLRTEMDTLVLGNFYTRDRPANAVARARNDFTINPANTRGGE